MKESISKRCVEVLSNLEFWSINKSKDNINRDGQEWWWLSKHKMESKFYGMYMDHPPNTYDEWE